MKFEPGMPSPQDVYARYWFDSSNPAVGVGAKHHTVPAFVLRRFADKDGMLLVRERASGELSTRAVSKLAVTDFYTVLNTDGEFDGPMEQLLATVEGQAAALFRLLLSAFRKPGPLSLDEQVTVSQFLAFQMMRGPRKRREIELLADYTLKLQAGDALTGQDLRQLTAVPHPNEHIRLMGAVSFEIFKSLLSRPVQIVQLDAPLLVICDEPVLVDIDNHVRHLPACSVRQGKLRRQQRQTEGKGTFRQIVHVWPTRPSGVQAAEAVAMPLSPSALLVLGQPGEQAQYQLRLTGDEARDVAHEVNMALVDQAYEWVAAHPGHPSFADWTFPPPGPLIGICDGGSVMSEQLRAAPPHRWQRLRKDWPAEDASPG
jgi:hypothetical protein